MRMIIIPARLESTRFPGKALVDIMGLPMVVRTARQVCELDNVCVATDSEKIIEACKAHDIEAVMTSSHHKSGTDRIHEAATILELPEQEIIINVQADEPFIEPDVVSKVMAKTQMARLGHPDILMSSCYMRVEMEDAQNPNLVKTVVDAHDNALYFSRSYIPFPRGENAIAPLGHLGIYGFTKKNLAKFCSFDHAPLEETEALEQLRALYHGYKITMVEVETKSFGIDTPDDLKKALEIHNSHKQKA